MTRARSSRSARQAGAKHERAVADYLARHVDERVDRRVRSGVKDRGDITALRTHTGGRVVVECKDTRTLLVGAYLLEVETERGNDDALAGVVVCKRHGRSDPGEAVVLMTLRDLTALITGYRPGEEE